MGDKLTYDELLAAYHDMQRERDMLMAAAHEQAVEIEQLKQFRMVLYNEYESKRLNWYQQYETMRNERNIMREQLGVVSRKLHQFTGK